MSAEVADVLRDALALIEDERNWCQGALTRQTEHGVAYCAVGAMEAVCSAPGRLGAYGALTEAMTGQRYGSVATFNNSHTHAEVIAAFKAAIVAEEWSA